MTTIAWDGQTLAADRQATNGYMRFPCTKIRRLPSGDIVAYVGTESSGEALLVWYANGADPGKWPITQGKEDWARLVVASRAGARSYEAQPHALPVECPFMAWGSGRDFAMAAMHLGKSAREAIEIACVFDTGSGLGVDALEVE
jgi:ATP-dependent protease HslVU (ClpYQ) peptidase subunit